MLHHPSYHLLLLPTCFLKLLVLLQFSLSPLPCTTTPLPPAHQWVPSYPFISDSRCSFTFQKSLKASMNKIVTDPPRGSLCQPPPLQLGFWLPRRQQEQPVLWAPVGTDMPKPLPLSSPSLPPRLLLGSTPRFLESSTPCEPGDIFSAKLPPKAWQPKPTQHPSALMGSL